MKRKVDLDASASAHYVEVYQPCLLLQAKELRPEDYQSPETDVSSRASRKPLGPFPETEVSSRASRKPLGPFPEELVWAQDVEPTEVDDWRNDAFRDCADELILLIALFLPPTSIDAWASTGRRFHRIMQEPQLWVDYYLTHYASVIRPGVIDLRSRCRHIETLTKKPQFKFKYCYILMVKYQADRFISRVGTLFNFYSVLLRLIYRTWINPVMLAPMWAHLQTDPSSLARFFECTEHHHSYRLLNKPSIEFLRTCADPRTNRVILDTDWAIHHNTLTGFTFDETRLRAVIAKDADVIYKARYFRESALAAVLSQHYQSPKIRALVPPIKIASCEQLSDLALELFECCVDEEDFSRPDYREMLNNSAIEYLLGCCEVEIWSDCLNLDDLENYLEETYTYRLLLQQLYPHICHYIPTTSYYSFFNAGYEAEDLTYFIYLLCSHPAPNFSLSTYLTAADGYETGLPSSTRECTKLMWQLQNSGRTFEPLKSQDIYTLPDQDIEPIFSWNHHNGRIVVTLGAPDYACLVIITWANITSHYQLYDETITLDLGLDDEVKLTQKPIGTIVYSELG